MDLKAFLSLFLLLILQKSALADQFQEKCHSICKQNEENCDIISKQDCDFNECIQGCQYVKVGLKKGCYQACSNNTNETFQSDGSKLNCIDVCKQTSQKFMTSVIKSVQNVIPPNIVAN